MADKNQQSAFMPSMEGPFSQYLNPSQSPYVGQANIPVPGAKIPRTAAAAAIIDKFLEGVSKGRERSFLAQQEQQQRQVGVLTNKLNQILNDPRIVDSDKQAAAQPIYRALGQIMGGAIDQGQGQQKKGKKGQGGQGVEEGQQPQGVGHHVVGIMKDFAVGLAGGKFPKELDPQTVKNLVGGALVDADTALSKAPTVEALTNEFQTGMAKAAQGVQGKTWDQAAPAFDQYRTLAMKIDPTGRLWQQTSQDYQTRFPSGKESYLGNPKKFKEDFQEAHGREPNSNEINEAVFGLKTPAVGYVSPKPIQGKNLNFAYDRNGDPRDPSKYYLEGKDGTFQPTEAPKLTGPQQAREDALNAWREKNHIPPGTEPSGTQVLDALRESKEATTPTDVAKRRQLQAQISEETLRQAHQGTANMKTLADGIADGTLPPDLSGLRLYGKEGEALLAEMKRSHPEFNLKDARLDYLGQQSYMRTLNSQQQVRLRQAIEFPFESLDLIDNGKGGGFSPELSKLIDRSKYPILNKAAMTAALSGAFGQQAMDAARKLDIQITDLQSELAVVYKGGNSPTDKGLEQAQKLLSGNWNEESLRQAIDLSRTNLHLRLNSIKNTLPYTIGGMEGGAFPPGAPGRTARPQPATALAVNNVSGIKRDGNFVQYASPQQGFQATVQDLRSKISGRTGTGLSGTSSLSDLVNTWTTGDASGTGAGYNAGDVAGYLKGNGIKVDENTPVSQIPAGQLAAAIAHFETGYDASDSDLKQAELVDRAEKNAGVANPFRRNSAPAPLPGAPANNRLGLPISQ